MESQSGGQRGQRGIIDALLLLLYLWTCWVFIAAQASLQLQPWGLLSSCGVWASHCSGFSCCGAWALGLMIVGSLIATSDGSPLQDSSHDNPMDRGAWRATVHGVAKSWPQLSD